MTLFDPIERFDSSPCRETEDSFTFLNRVDTPFWSKVRQLLEEWFAHYPVEEADKLRKAFRSDLPGHHWSAWWELYLHELFLRLDYEISLHPELPDSNKTPDFELQRDGSRLLVEATAVFSGIRGGGEDSSAPPPWMLAAINAVTNPNFFLHFVEVSETGEEQLKVSQIRDPLESWLGGLDPDQVGREYQQSGEFPRKTVEKRGWAMVFEAMPVKPEARGKPDHRVLGMGPAQGGWVDDVDQLESKLKAKAGRYGHPEIPLVTAVLSISAFMERLDIEQALFGREAVQISPDAESSSRLIRQRNGFWVRGDGPQNQRVSAVLMGVNIHPWSVTKAAPQLWSNPWANHPLQEDWPFTAATANDAGAISYREASSEPSAWLDLPEDWPGGKLFPREG